MRRPPRVATFLLEHLGYGLLSDSLVGDLIEQYQQGRSRAWYWKQSLFAIAVGLFRGVHSILLDGGRAMLKFAVTFLLLGLFIAVSTRMALGGFFNPVDWTAAAGMFATVNGMIMLVLLTLRAVWRSSSKVLQSLYWPTAIAAGIVGLSGIATVLNTVWLARQSGDIDFYLLRVGGFVVLMCFLTAFSLWRTRQST